MDQQVYYEEYWKKGGQNRSEYIQFKQNILRNIDDNSLIFDYGGGDGLTVEKIKNKDNIIVGDISKNALKAAKRKGFKTVIIDDNFEFESLQRYNNILLFDCLEHMIDPEYIFRKIAENLKPGSELYISVPNMLNIFTRIFFIFGKYIDFNDKSHITGELFTEHIQLFSKEKLEKLLVKYELVIIKKYFYMPKNIEISNNILIKIGWKILFNSKVYEFFPSLFSLNFLYVCKKK